jgi:TPR repeat protein
VSHNFFNAVAAARLLVCPLQGKVEEAAMLGLPVAMGIMSERFYFGEDGCVVDPEKSTAWAVKAAAAGDRVGQFRLAWAYQYGEGGLAVDFRQATAWFKRAAEQGCEASMNNLVRVSSLARAVSCSLSALRMLFFFFFSPATLTHAHPALPCGCSFIL